MAQQRRERRIIVNVRLKTSPPLVAVRRWDGVARDAGWQRGYRFIGFDYSASAREPQGAPGSSEELCGALETSRELWGALGGPGEPRGATGEPPGKIYENL